METFWFFRLRFRRAYDSAYDSVFRFSLGHKRFYDSDYDSVATENQPLELFSGHFDAREIRALFSYSAAETYKAPVGKKMATGTFKQNA